MLVLLVTQIQGTHVSADDFENHGSVRAGSKWQKFHRFQGGEPMPLVVMDSSVGLQGQQMRPAPGFIWCTRACRDLSNGWEATAGRVQNGDTDASWIVIEFQCFEIC